MFNISINAGHLLSRIRRTTTVSASAGRLKRISDVF